MPFDLTFFALAIPAVIFAGFSKGGFGSGAAFAAGSILVLIVEPAIALGVLLPLLMLVDLACLRPYWGRWSWREARILILASLPGVAIGAAIYEFTNADILRFLIGAISLLFVGYQLASARGLIPRPAAAPSARWGSLAGATAGFTSFVSHAGGPPVAVYLLARGMDKTTYQATSVLVFWAVNIFKAVPYGALGIFTVQTLQVDLVLAPFALLGCWLGIVAHRRVPERLFFTITYAALTLTGTKLIWDALT